MKTIKPNMRREFIKASLFSGINLLFAGHTLAQINSTLKASRKIDLIRQINLQTSKSLEEMIAFYQGKLGLKICEHDSKTCSFQAGNSILKFTHTKTLKNPPFYHFAFNIPENKIRYAEEWQLKRSDIITPPLLLRDSDYSKNIVHFRHWNAHSIFFYDPAGNVVEFIARHTLSNYSNGKFSEKDILNISEIGLIADNVDELFADIVGKISISKYFDSSQRFLAMGDEMGLIILFAKDTRAVFDTGRRRDFFETEISINLENQATGWISDKYPFKISL